MFNFLSLKPESFGLDFSDSALRLVKLRRKGNDYNIASYSEISIPSGIIMNGEIKDENVLADHIKKLISSVKGSSLGTKYVVASLPEKKAFLRVIQMPCLSEDDLKSAVVFEAENYIPMSTSEVYLDSQIISNIKQKDQEHYDVLIAALPKKTVDPYFSVLKKAGLTPTALEIESFSIVRTLIKDNESCPVGIIDLQPSRTAFILFSGKTLTDSFTIAISSKEFVDSIRRNLEVDEKTAEKLKNKYGLENEKAQGKKVFDALTPVITDLVEQIKKYLDYYNTHNDCDVSGKNKLEKVILTGDISLKKFKEILESQLSLKVEMGNPWVNITKDKIDNNFPKEKELRFTSAIGLALRGIKRQ